MKLVLAERGGMDLVASGTSFADRVHNLGRRDVAAIHNRLFESRELRLLAVLGTSSLFVLLCGVAAAAESKAGDPALEIALAAWEKSAARLQSYDLYLRADTTNMIDVVDPRSRESGKESGDKPKFLLPGKEPARLTESTRQILSKQGKRRYEILEPGRDSGSHVRVFDGESVRWLSGKGVTAGVSRGPDKEVFGSFHTSYGSLYRALPLGGTIFPLLRARQKTRLVQGRGGERNYVVIESPPEGENYYPKLELKIALDPSHGMMPAKIDSGFRTTVQPRCWRMTIDKFHEVEPGVWAPVTATYRWGPPDNVFSIIKVAVDMGRSHWNQPVSEDLFTIEPPDRKRR